LFLTFVGLGAARGQSLTQGSQSMRSTPAYAEVLLRKTELMADLDAYSGDYTDTNPKVLEARAELASIDRSLDRLLGVKPTDTGRLTEALGRMMVKKAALDADLARLTRSYNKEHPEVRRAQRRADYFESAINELLK
jgi:hypothetical protein